MSLDSALLCSSINFMAFRNDDAFSATCSKEEFDEILCDLGLIFAKPDFEKKDLANMNLSSKSLKSYGADAPQLSKEII